MSTDLYAVNRDALIEDIETSVIDALNERRWFGKHVDDDELDDLYADIRTAILDAVIRNV